MKLSILRRAAMLLVILCVALPAFASCNSFADTEYAVVSENNISTDGFIYDKYENSTVKITGIESMPAILIIPEKIDGMPVAEIGEYAFSGSDVLVYLALPAADIKLGRGFCADCVALISVDLADSVTSIPDNAFENCGDLATVERACAVTEIGSQAFAGCSSLSYFNIPNQLAVIGSEAFRGCTSLPSVTLPETLTAIGDSAFWGCENLVTVTVGGTANIPQYCFLGCTRLTEVIFGDGVKAIGEEAFRSCRELYSVTFGKNISEIGSYAFHACDSLTEVRFTDKKANITVGDGNEALGLSN